MQRKRKFSHFALACRAVWTIVAIAVIRTFAADSIAPSALSQLHELSTNSLKAPYLSRDEHFVRFRKLLADISTSPQRPGQTTDEVTLLRVARGLAKDPERLEELLSTYDHGTIPSRVAQPPPLRAEHVSEACRSAWEALLLAPRCPRITLIADGGVVTEALQRLGNTNSIPVLELAFNLSCDPLVASTQDHSWLSDRQCSIMHVLASFPAEDSLRLILRLLEQAETAWFASGKPNGYLSDVTPRMLTHQNDPVKEDQWRRILGSFPKETLPPKQRALLDSAIRQQESKN